MAMNINKTLRAYLLAKLFHEFRFLCDVNTRDKRIETIKAIRAASGFGLKESKDIVEYYWNNPNDGIGFESLINEALDSQYGTGVDPVNYVETKKFLVFGKSMEYSRAFLYEADSEVEAHRVNVFLHDNSLSDGWNKIAKEI